MQNEMTDEGISYFLQHIKRFSRDIDKAISVGDQATRLLLFRMLIQLVGNFILLSLNMTINSRKILPGIN